MIMVIEVTKSEDQVLQLGKEERENKNPMEIKVKVYDIILFWHSRHHRGCVYLG
jgi:hypothetical protein